MGHGRERWRPLVERSGLAVKTPRECPRAWSAGSSRGAPLDERLAGRRSRPLPRTGTHRARGSVLRGEDAPGNGADLLVGLDPAASRFDPIEGVLTPTDAALTSHFPPRWGVELSCKSPLRHAPSDTRCDFPRQVSGRAQRITGGRGVDLAVNATPGGSARTLLAVENGGRLATITSDPPDPERALEIRQVYMAPEGPRLGTPRRTARHRDNWNHGGFPISA